MAMKITDKDLGWKRLQDMLRKSQGKAHAVVGVFGAKADEDHGGLPNVVIACTHEFGLKIGNAVIPERSFIRGTVDAKTKEIAAMAKKLASLVIDGTTDIHKALDVLGQYVRGLIQARISAGIPPPLKPATIARKGSSKPLIDTGQLRASIDTEVRAA